MNIHTNVLNILYRKTLKKQHNNKIYNENYIKDVKHHSPSYKVWNNSIYNFNKSVVKSLPIKDDYILGIIRNFFNFYSTKIENTSKLKYVRRWQRRFSLVRILLSKVELKHTNDNITINLYIFNRQRVFYINKLIKLKKKILMYISYFNNKNDSNIKNIYNEKTYSKKFNISGNFAYNKNILEKKKIFDILKYKLISNKNKNIINKIMVYDNNDVLKTINYTILNKYNKKLRLIIIKKFLFIEKFYLLFKQNLFINNYKFKSTYILPLTKILEKIYNKKIFFNIICLKYPYLDSSIYLQLIKIKLRKRKNRIAKILRKSLAKIRVIRPIKLITLSEVYSERLRVNNVSVYKFLNNDSKNISNDKLNTFINYYTNFKKENSSNFVLDILKLIKYKTFIGLRVEASGRLTKRITASRSLFKLNHIGGIKNIYSSLKGIRSTISRGNLNSNLDTDKLSYKTRIGSYGLKSWVNSI